MHKLCWLALALTMGCGGGRAAAPSEVAGGPPPPGVRAGEAAPTTTVTAADGARLELADAWAQTPVVLVFYRGYWCPHCRAQLSDLQAHLDELSQHGVRVAAIGGDKPADAAKLRDRLGLGYDVYSDAAGDLMRTWRVWDAPRKVAMPAMFIVAPGGQVVFAYVGKNPSDHPTVGELLRAFRVWQTSS